MARPTFSEPTAAELAELNRPAPAPRQAAQPAENLIDAPAPLKPTAEAPAPVPEPAEAPTNVQRQPAESTPLLSERGSVLAKEHTNLEAAFDEADKKAALESAKTPEQREEETVAAEAAKSTLPAPVTEPAITTAETDKTITEVEAELASPNLKNRDRKRYKELLGSLKAEKTARAEYEAKLKEIEARPPTKTDDSELAKLREEAATAKADAAKVADENLKYRRRYDLESDPTVIERFEKPVKQAEESITKVLAAHELGKPTLDLIEKSGGFAAFSKSGKIFNVTEMVDGVATKVQRTAAELTRSWLDAMAPADAEEVRTAMSEQIRAKAERSRFVQEETSKADEYFKAQRSQGTAQTEAQVAAQKKIAEDFNKWAAEEPEKTEWLKKKEIPSTATPEQKAEIEKENAFIEETRSFLKAPIKPDPAVPDSGYAQYRQMVKDAAELRVIKRQAPKADARIKELEAQVARLQGATATTPAKKAGSILPGAVSASAPKPKRFDPMKDDLAAKLEKEMFEAMGSVQR